MADSEDDDLDIYINNQEDNIEDELYTYLHKIRADKKVSISLLLNILRTTKDFLIIFLYLDTNLYIDQAIRILEI
jgi:SMC interacting uncharacterized protein involved in chromosome segregation